MIMQIMTSLPQIWMWPVQCVSVPDLKLFGPMNTELWAKEVGEFSVMFYGKMGLAHLS